MSKREPFALQKVIIIYDLIQIILNFALFVYVNLFEWKHKPIIDFWKIFRQCIAGISTDPILILRANQ